MKYVVKLSPTEYAFLAERLEAQAAKLDEVKTNDLQVGATVEATLATVEGILNALDAAEEIL